MLIIGDEACFLPFRTLFAPEFTGKAPPSAPLPKIIATIFAFVKGVGGCSKTVPSFRFPQSRKGQIRAYILTAPKSVVQ